MFDREDIVQRLKRRFPVGSKPELRLALYERIGQLVEDRGDVAYHVVAEVAADAAGKRNPAHWFCFVVIRRLIERGIIDAPEL